LELPNDISWYILDTQEGSKIQTGLSHHPARDPAHLNDHKIATVGIVDKLFHDVPNVGNDANYKLTYEKTKKKAKKAYTS